MRKPLRWSGLSFERLFSSLLVLYLVSTAVLEWPLYPAWSHRLQPPELVFILISLLLLPIVARQGINYRTIQWNDLDLAVAVYLLVNFLSVLIHSSGHAILEMLGKVYLAAVYLLFKLASQWDRLNWGLIISGFRGLALLLIGSIFTAYFLLYLGLENSLLAVHADYPYLGTVYRAKGTLQTPSMFISMVNWCFLFLLTDVLFRDSGRRHFLLLGGLLTLAVLSFSKAILLSGLIVIILWTWSRYGRQVRAAAAVVTGIVALTYLTLTNFVYVSEPGNITIDHSFLAVDELPSSNTVRWVPTSYFALKQAALHMGAEHLTQGVGPGNFIDELPGLKHSGDYPEHLPLHDPHSVLFGAFAETGIPGLLSLLFLLGAALQRLLHRQVSDPFRIALLTWLVIFIIEGLNGDLMNFRHYWISLGLISGLAHSEAK